MRLRINLIFSFFFSIFPHKKQALIEQNSKLIVKCILLCISQYAIIFSLFHALCSGILNYLCVIKRPKGPAQGTQLTMSIRHPPPPLVHFEPRDRTRSRGRTRYHAYLTWHYGEREGGREKKNCVNSLMTSLGLSLILDLYFGLNQCGFSLSCSGPDYL